MSEEATDSAVEGSDTAGPALEDTRRRDFQLLWAGESISKLGTGVSGVALSLIAVSTLQASTFMLGLLRAAAWLPWLVVGLPAGVWIDRLPRRGVLLSCDVVALLLLLSVPAAAWSGVLGIGQLALVALGVGVCSVFFTAAYQAYIPTLVAKEGLPTANARLQTSEQVAGVAGPGVGGLLAQTVGAVSGVVTDAVSFAVSAICLLRIRTRESRHHKRHDRRRLRTEIAEGVRFVAHDPYLRILTLAGAVDNLTWTSSMTLFVVFLIRDAGVAPGLVGILTAMDSIGGIAGALLATRIARRFGTAHGMLLAALGTAPFTLLIPLAGPGARVVLYAFGLMVAGAGMIVSNILSSGFRQAYVPQEILGRVFASAWVLQFGIIPVAALLGGTLGTVLGIRESMWLTLSAGVLAKSIRLLGPVRKHRDLPTSLPETATAARSEATTSA